MDKIISLYGSYRGMLRLTGNTQKPTAMLKGAPEGSVIYIINTKGAYLFTGGEINESNIQGAIIVHDNRIIMEGLLRNARVDMRMIKEKLRMELSKSAGSLQKADVPAASTAIVEATEVKPYKSEALREILESADKLFNTPVQGAVQAGKTQSKPQSYNPFPDTYPNSRWKKVRYGRGGHYLEGRATVQGVDVLIHGIPGEFPSGMSVRHKDFDRFMRSIDGKGYWVRVKRV